MPAVFMTSHQPPPAAHAAHFSSCTPTQLHAHLLHVGIDAGDAQQLLQEDVDGLSFPSLTHAHLQDMGIPTFGRRQRILLALSLGTPAAPAAANRTKVAEAEHAAHPGLMSHFHLGRPKTASPFSSAPYHTAPSAASYAVHSQLARPHSAQTTAPTLHRASTSPHYSPIPSLPITPYEQPAGHSSYGSQLRQEQMERQEELGELQDELREEDNEERRRREREQRMEAELKWEQEQQERRREQLEVLRLKDELQRRERAKQRISDAQLDATEASARDRRPRHSARHERRYSDDATPLSPPPPRPFPHRSAHTAVAAAPAVVTPPPLTPPSRSLHLEWVYGYTASSSARNNVIINGTGALVYPAGRVVVVLDRKHGGEASQAHFTAHDGVVRALAQHPINRNIVASSASPLVAGGVPVVLVWDSAATHVKPVSIPLAAADVGVRSLAFSCDGQHLATLSCDADHTLRVWHWATAQLVASVHTAPATSTPASSPLVHSCRWNSQSPHDLVTVGRRHLAFWSFKDGKIRGQKALQPPHHSSSPAVQYESVAFSAKGYACVGSSGGTVVVYTDAASEPRSFPVQEATARITCMDAWKGGLVTGGDDGGVVVTNRSMEVVRRWQYEARVVAVGWRGEAECVVGTRDGRVWKVADVWAKDGEGSRGEVVMHGHHDGQLSALAALDARRCVTAGEDNCIILWDVDKRRAERRTALAAGRSAVSSARKTGHDSHQRAVCVTAGGGIVVAGTEDGHLVVLSSALRALHRVHVEQAVQQSKHRDSRRGAASASSSAITCLALSPSHHQLAVGTGDGAVLLFGLSTTAFNLLSLCCASSAAIVHMDWSASSSALLVTDAVTASTVVSVSSSDHALSVKPASAASTAVQHTGFASVSSPLSFSTHALFTTAPARSIAHCLVATLAGGGAGKDVARDDGLCCVAGLGRAGDLRLYRYTGLCVSGQQWREVAAHAGRVGDVRWVGTNRLVSVGKDDLTVIQWRVL